MLSGVMEVQKHKSKVRERNNLKIHLEGGVITMDDFLHVEEESSKEKSKKSKQKGKMHEEQATGYGLYCVKIMHRFLLSNLTSSFICRSRYGGCGI